MADQNTIAVQVDVDTAAGKAKLAELMASLQNLASEARGITLGASPRAPIKVDVDTAAASAKVDSLRKPIGPEAIVPLSVTADTADATAKVDELRRPTGTDKTVPLKVDVDTAGATAKLDALREHGRASLMDKLRAGLSNVGPPTQWGAGLVKAGGMLGGGVGSLRAMPGLLGLIPGLFGAIGTAGRLAFGAVDMAVRSVSAVIRGVFGLAVTGAKLALGGLAAVAGLAFAGVMGALKALGPAMRKEMALAQWETMLGSLAKAKQRFAELEAFNLATPFQTPEIDAAARMMQVFGFYSIRNLRAVGDAAAAMQKNIVDAVHPLSMLRMGLFHSHMMAPIGLSRNILEKEGVKFGRSGEMKTSGTKAFDVAVRYFEKRFGGMAAKMALTWKGIMSNLGDAWNKMWASLGEGPLKRLKPALQDVFLTMANLAETVKGFDLPWLDKLGMAAKVVRGIVADLTNPQVRSVLGGMAGAAVKAVPEYAGGVMQAAVKGFGAVADKLLMGLPIIFSAMANAFIGAWRVGVALLRDVWSGIGAELQDRLHAAVSIPEQTAQAEERRTALKAQLNMQAGNDPAKRAAVETFWHAVVRDKFNPFTSRKTLQEFTAGKGAQQLRQAGLDPTAALIGAEQQFRAGRGYDRPGAVGLGSVQEEETRRQLAAGQFIGPLKTVFAGAARAFWDTFTGNLPAVPNAFAAIGDEFSRRGALATREQGVQRFVEATKPQWQAMMTPAYKPRYNELWQPSRERRSERAARERLGETEFIRLRPFIEKLLMPLSGRSVPAPQARAIVAEARRAYTADHPAQPMERNRGSNRAGEEMDRFADGARKATTKLAEAVESFMGKLRSGMGLSPDFTRLMGMGPRDRADMRKTGRLDATIKDKMEDLEKGNRVHFTAREKRRIEEAGGRFPKEDRRWRGHYDENRIGGLDDRRIREMDRNRIQGLGPQRAEAPAMPSWAAQFIAELKASTRYEREAAEALRALTRQEAIA